MTKPRVVRSPARDSNAQHGALKHRVEVLHLRLSVLTEVARELHRAGQLDRNITGWLSLDSMPDALFWSNRFIPLREWQRIVVGLSDGLPISALKVNGSDGSES